MDSERHDNEETPLLRQNDNNDIIAATKSKTLPGNDSDHRKPEETPLPWAQFSLVLFLQLAEPLTSQVIYPFAPELIRTLGVTDGDETRVGYYVGLMQSIFFATQALTVLHWSRFSDYIGRKPVILMGLSGLSLSMYCFGLSRTFTGLVISRSLNGALNGNIGVIKSIMGEMTDSTNVARAFAYQPIPWSTGATLGPMIGGSLSRPAEKFPNLFGDSEFLKTYPYFLPCAVPATFSLVALVVTYFFLEESNPTGFSILSIFKKASSDTKDSSKLESSIVKPATAAPSLSSLLTPRVILSASNYALLSLLDIAYRALQPVYLSTPPSLGGPGMSPRTIGIALACLGLGNGLFQVFFFARTIRWFGVKRMYLIGIWSAVPIFLTFPAMTVLVRWGRTGGSTSSTSSIGLDGITPAASYAIYGVVALQLLFTILLNTCYGCVFIFITSAAPSKRTLGATNGLAQMLVSIMRAVGPAAAASLFSFSLELGQVEGGVGGQGGVGGMLAGWLVYAVMLVVVAVAGTVGRLLPDVPWVREEETTD